MSGIRLSLAFVLLSSPSLALAQRPVVLGDTVKVIWAVGTGSFTGTVGAASNQGLVVQGAQGDERQIPVELIRSLTVRAGSKPATGKGARIGLFIGAIAGLGLGVAAARGGDDLLIGGAEVIPVSVLGGGLGGAFWGAIVGSLSQTERWVSARLPDAGQPPTMHGAPRRAPFVGMGVESTVLVGLRLRR